MKKENEIPKNNDYQETVDLIDSKTTSHQVLTAAVIAGVVCALLVLATLLSLVSAEVWKNFVFSMVQAGIVLIAFVWIGKKVYSTASNALDGFLIRKNRKVPESKPSAVPAPSTAGAKSPKSITKK